MLLEYLAENYPPKWGSLPIYPANIETELVLKTNSTVLKKLSCLYHPDRNTMFGQRWLLLTQEISKSVNSIYQLRIRSKN